LRTIEHERVFKKSLLFAIFVLSCFPDMDRKLFLDILGVDSTSSKEREMALVLSRLFKTERNSVDIFEVGDGTLNLLFSWGSPSVFFCTHMDTVPPYIPTTVKSISKGDVLPDGRKALLDDTIYLGRGTCDAKGQIIAMWEACKALEAEGLDGFGLLLLSGEETGSFGAKAYTRDCPGGELVVVGEPTDNLAVKASKGTKSFGVRILGRPCHSGYPDMGESAVDKFVSLCNNLSKTEFPLDDVLGKTTWNIGKLSSNNPQNILSPELVFRIYFRTTFSSHAFVEKYMESLASSDVQITSFGGDTPMEYFVPNGLDTTVVSFGSDAPRLDKFRRRSLCGPGSILVAHTEMEYVLESEIEKAARQYVGIFKNELL